MINRFVAMISALIFSLFCSIVFAKSGPQLAISGKIYERHQMKNGDWNLQVKIKMPGENQDFTGWVYYDPEKDFSSWTFFDVDLDPTKNMELAETFQIENILPNSDFLKAYATEGAFELVKPLSEKRDETFKIDFGLKPNGTGRKSAYPLVPDNRYWDSKCSNFIDGNGNINSWGLTVIQAVERYPEYLKSIILDMPNYCPNFSKFNGAERENFWVWFIAAVAMRESSCNPQARAKGPNGIAAGLLQLHLHKEYAYHSDCRNTNALDAHQNLSCGSAMFDNQLIHYKRMFISRGSYWQTLQSGSGGNGVRKLLALYRPCR